MYHVSVAVAGDDASPCSQRAKAGSVSAGWMVSARGHVGEEKVENEMGIRDTRASEDSGRRTRNPGAAIVT